MQPISVEAFASMVMKNNKGYRKKELVKMLNDTLTAKNTTLTNKITKLNEKIDELNKQLLDQADYTIGQSIELLVSAFRAWLESVLKGSGK